MKELIDLQLRLVELKTASRGALELLEPTLQYYQKHQRFINETMDQINDIVIINNAAVKERLEKRLRDNAAKAREEHAKRVKREKRQRKKERMRGR